MLREVAGLAGEPGERRVRLTEPVGEHFHAGEAELHYPADVMHEAVDDSKKALEEMGMTFRPYWLGMMRIRATRISS